MVSKPLSIVNILVTDNCFKLLAQVPDNRHVVKMILENTQVLSTIMINREWLLWYDYRVIEY